MSLLHTNELPTNWVNASNLLSFWKKMTNKTCLLWKYVICAVCAKQKRAIQKNNKFCSSQLERKLLRETKWDVLGWFIKLVQVCANLNEVLNIFSTNREQSYCGVCHFSPTPNVFPYSRIFHVNPLPNKVTVPQQLN